MDAAISKGSWRGLRAGICAVVGLLLVWSVASALVGNSLDKPAQQVVFQAAAVLILLSLHHYFNSDTPISSTGALGRAGRIATAGSLGVIAIHVVAFAHAMFFDVPVEPKMMEIRATEGIGAWSRLLLSAVVLAPIWEELFFRRFLLELFPVQRSWLWAAFGGLATAAAFAAFHYSYMYPSTFVLLGVLGLIFAWVRIRSGTLWAPILLHAVAAVTGLLLNLLR
ncbi:CPBP family intramembrane glutamic endopeptidase [Piscinibacter gummiphilus]|uniref:CPBP family intramembrane glutamic endopeptidase n=1 Tax=Piscinibacter gummiphilus TaxID=946333 RepID=A0ABZ0CM18_9BURK|nr:CPBP family intramembrane glutamic endopeptidase [Piscinibacter gummiphilus]WOB05873.1 CPBP family intramembrane glutamic endopeptidase [Piscinibacter gummiphilus]